MTIPSDRYADLLRGPDDRALGHLVSDIDEVLRAPAPPHALRVALQQELHRRTTVARRPRRPRTRGLPWRPTRRWAVSLGAALLLIASGVAGYLRLTPPTPVSAAQVVLRHASAAFQAVPADRASHATYAITPEPPSRGVYLFGTTAATGTLDTWIQLDVHGAVARQATTVYSGTATMINRTVQTAQMGQAVLTYDARAGTVMTTTLSTDDLSSPHLFDAAGLQHFVQAAGQNADPSARLLPAQPLDGHTVDVVEIDQPRFHEKMTLYIDAQTYVLRRLDAATVTAEGNVLDAFALHLLRADTAPASSLPAQTFALDAPTTARVLQPSQAEPLTVAQAVDQGAAASDMPDLLLSSDPSGLRLQGVRKDTYMGASGIIYSAPAGR